MPRRTARFEDTLYMPQAAERLGITIVQTYDLIDDGEIDWTRDGGENRLMRVLVDSIEAYEARRIQPPGAGTTGGSPR